ncbi:hypothetical protein CRENBAI_015875 [Crenichthys baileyi]|uniref:Uncharacterized protein n=1 Tax=Crenichthys baileyi TaxID=28760 RepID=A0AAV9R800_9TELE
MMRGLLGDMTAVDQTGVEGTLATPIICRLENVRQDSTERAAFFFSSSITMPASPFASLQYLRFIICSYKPLCRAKVLIDLLGFTKGFYSQHKSLFLHFIL